MVEVIVELGLCPRPQMRTPNGFRRALTLSVPCPCGLGFVQRPGRCCELMERVLRGKRKAPTLEGRGAAHRLTVTRWGTWDHYSPRPSRVGAYCLEKESAWGAVPRTAEITAVGHTLGAFVCWTFRPPQTFSIQHVQDTRTENYSQPLKIESPRVLY